MSPQTTTTMTSSATTSLPTVNGYNHSPSTIPGTSVPLIVPSIPVAPLSLPNLGTVIPSSSANGYFIPAPISSITLQNVVPPSSDPAPVVAPVHVAGPMPMPIPSKSSTVPPLQHSALQLLAQNGRASPFVFEPNGNGQGTVFVQTQVGGLPPRSVHMPVPHHDPSHKNSSDIQSSMMALDHKTIRARVVALNFAFVPNTGMKGVGD